MEHLQFKRQIQMYYCMIHVHFVGLSQATGYCNKNGLNISIRHHIYQLMSSLGTSIQVSESSIPTKIFLGMKNQLANCIINYNFANGSYKLVHIYKQNNL